jgi:serine/threonine-protein kinase HipA
MRSAKIFVNDKCAGILKENENGYNFQYLPEYISEPGAEPVSLTFPLRLQAFQEKHLFPFFDGLIPEGWLLEIAEKNWKLNPRDRMGLLLQTCFDCIGNVRIEPVLESQDD